MGIPRSLRDRSESGAGKIFTGEYNPRRSPEQAPKPTIPVEKVFEGVHIVNNEKCIIKALKPVEKKKVKREIKILQNLAGGPNIVALLDVIRDPTSKIPSLIMEYIHNVDFRVLYPRFTEYDVRFYMFELLKVRALTSHHWRMSC